MAIIELYPRKETNTLVQFEPLKVYSLEQLKKIIIALPRDQTLSEKEKFDRIVTTLQLNIPRLWELDELSPKNKELKLNEVINFLHTQSDTAGIMNRAASFIVTKQNELLNADLAI